MLTLFGPSNKTKIQRATQNAIEEFQKTHSCKCKNELATLAYFHLFFFDILKNEFKRLNCAVEIEFDTLISFHIDKSPIVHVNDVNHSFSCELGDLLFIVESNKENKAVLIQAKQDLSSYDQGSTINEKRLYNEWPLFQITKPNILYQNNYKITFDKDKISRFITFFNKKKFSPESDDGMSFDYLLSSFLSSCRKIGRQFVINSKYSLKVKHQYIILKRRLWASKIGDCKEDIDSWNYLINHLSEYLKERIAYNKTLGKKFSKRNITHICFVENEPEEDPADIIDKLLDGKYENYEIHLFSLVRFRRAK